MKTLEIPKDGLEGLKQNFTADSLSGFLVFLLALPLSLGIAKASGFPAAMGVLTAMIGGIVVSIFQGGRLTIKGPAAGLITVCAGAVTDLGGLGMDNVSAVNLACGAIVVMSVIQFVFGMLKFGSFSDFFPHSAVHGMLAAIGVLIFAKQFPILLGVPGDLVKGLTPIQLYTHIPIFIANATPQIAMIGLLSLVIIFGLPMLGGFFKKIPAPMIVLLIMIPLAAFLDFKTNHAAALVTIGDFWGNVKFNASFAAIGTGVFWKYVLMFLFVNSLESLLTVKAIDGLDPYKRQSDYNKDLRALSLGNGISGLLGGLPMISEVARSSANVNYGGKTRWANFFHGLFLLVSMIVLIPLIEMIPTAALAAMLIAVAYRLASPKEFIGTYKVGPEQFVIFVVTIIVTVGEDLLLGVGAGILTKFLFHIINGAPIKALFKADYSVTESENSYLINVKGVATFSNFLGFKKLWSTLKPGKNIIFNFEQAKLVDHSFMDQLHHFEDSYHLTGGHVSLTNLDHLNALSSHPLAARKVMKEAADKIEIRLSPRQIALRKFANANEYDFNSQHVRVASKYKDFPIQAGNKIRFEENVLSKYADFGKVEIADMTLIQGAGQAGSETHVTVVHISETDLPIPDFALEPESFGTKFSELMGGKDIDFAEFPEFSSKYYLRGEPESGVRSFFSESVVRFLENREEIHIECHKHRLLIYKKLDLLDTHEIDFLEKYAEEFVQVIKQRLEQPVAL
ncbi:MAG: SulP family inorganic anion transporter [Cyclobacteriaceae bacterium]|nr:SulP family inorganic anion transporter [Cyclobacteriaceae bacterium]